MRRLNWLLLVTLALALASCRENPTGPPIGALIVTPVGIMPCPYTSAPIGTPHHLQLVDCGEY